MAPNFIPAKDIIELSETKGFLAMQMFIVTTTPTGGMGPVMENLEPHLAFQGELEKAGVMFAAGANFTENGEEWRGEGTVVIRAGSIAEARQIMDKDPMHVSGARKYTVKHWIVNEGKITVELDYSSGKFTMI